LLEPPWQVLKHSALWEDLYDGLVSEQRRKDLPVSRPGLNGSFLGIITAL
jgi:hypothetical protein